MSKLLFVALLLLAGAALAQAPAPVAEKPPQDAMEPGVNTSAMPAAPAAQPAEPAPGSDAPATPAAPAANKPAGPAARGTAKDRLDLEATQITGNRELPKVLYIVPWRSAEMGDLVGRPVNSLLDEVLEPVDRDVFRRQNRYFEALQPNEAVPAGNPGK
ncbi:MAG TPA: hypothetical protein VFU13_10715 [Steroidobacteraceae bacterium]|nr:hypothetical protein [Steroidobacteraceae bacterium]